MSAMVFGKDNPVRIRSNGTIEGTRVHFRGADGEWHPVPGVIGFSVGVDMSRGDEVITAHLAIINPQVEVETETVTAHHEEAPCRDR